MTVAELFLVQLGWLWAAAWGAACLLAVARATFHLASLRRLERCSVPATEARLHRMLARVAGALGLHGRVRMRILPGASGPMAVGLWRRVVYLPGPEFTRRLDDDQLAAMLAHELAHLRRRDSLWALLGFLVRHAFFFQPLNGVVCRHLRAEAEYLADRDAVVALSNPLGLARCLATLGAYLAAGPAPAPLPVTAVGMTTFRSPLGQRIARILSDPWRHRLSAAQQLGWLVAMFVCLSGLGVAAPRAARDASAAGNREPNIVSRGDSGEANMKPASSILALAMAFAAGPTLADEPQAVGQVSPAETTAAQTPARAWVDVPETLHGFRGMFVGTVVDKDVEKGVLIFKVTDVKRVWRQNKASNPRSAIGKTLRVQGITGRFLDALIALQRGDGVEVEAFHDRGDSLYFPGEWLMKVELERRTGDSEADSSEEFAGGFPRELQGFSGLLVGKVVSKDGEAGLVTLTVQQVKRVWPGNKASRPASAVNKTLVVEGISGRWLDVLLTVKAGDLVELEARHVRGERLQFIPEGFRKVESVEPDRD